jgi:galactokinase
MQIPATLLPAFAESFGGRPRLFRAPGRVNLIGEHTDYTGGLVMPAAIHFSTWVAAGRREDRTIRAVSEGFPGALEFSLDQTRNRQGNWTDHVAGVAATLEAAGHRLRGANLLIRGEVPVGSGLSSSAAIEVATALALLKNSDLFMEPMQLALLCQRAENEFVGMRCGIMDQFASCFGRAGCALMLDCRSLEFELVRLPPDVQLVICNTMVKHDNATSEYNTRRAECEEAVRLLAQELPGVRSLRDVTFVQLDQHRGRLPEMIYKRCRHVITENDRVRQAARAFQIGDSVKLARLMADSHRSLRDDYQVSCSELDLMVEIASRQRGVSGARMTGGGFGGCTINLVAVADALEFQRNVASEYELRTGLRPDIFICEASAGAESVKVIPASGESSHFEDLQGDA